MSLLRRTGPFCALLAPALLGCSLSSDPAPGLGLQPGCNPLATSDECLLPFPSAFVQRDDASTPTGVRVDLPAEKLPLRDGAVPLDVAPYNAADGFSPVIPILLHFGVDIDTAPLPGLHHIEDSLRDGSRIAIFDMETGERVPYFAEMDRNLRDGYDGRYALILHPMTPMRMGARILVLVQRGLTDAAGRVIEPTPAFEAIRDGVETDSAELEAIRPRYDALFSFAATHGYPRRELLTAFDFQVASEDYLLGSVLSMREKALEMAGDTGLPYVITDVQEDPNDQMARIVFGDFEVPTFLREDDTFEYDAEHHPVLQPANRSYPFTMLIPKKAADGPLPLVVLGHGIFGTGRSFLTEGGDAEAIQALANQHGAVVIATDWIGLSTNDVARVGIEVGNNLDRIGVVTDQLQQALINALVMTKLARGALKDDPAIQVGAGPLIDLTRTWYWGASLGGIEGSSFVSISDDIARAAFGVPGSAWSTMLSRSVVFPPIRNFLEPHYPDPLDFLLGTTLVQARFDHADPANVTKLMFERPLPDAPPGRTVILQEAIGDSQVPNITTEILARSMGVKLLAPADYEVFGLRSTPSPTVDSVLAQYKMEGHDDPAPPEDNTPPEADNDVHHGMNFLPSVHAQIVHLWFEGEVRQFCEGSCDPD
ncbi:MAG: hypothetical protein IT372_19690 [Polyangiaceae bacterium]|nr:hypothetical protein [Polyangiaceae bacterium]